MMDTIFQWCVDVLNILAMLTGTTYREINVIVFCIVGPLMAVALVWYIVHLRKRIRLLETQ
jgi:hypothetical protein